MAQVVKFITKAARASAALTLIVFAGNAQSATVFTFSTPTVTNYTAGDLPSFTANSITASFSDPQGTLINPLALFNTNSSGICAWYAINNSTGRCGALTGSIPSNNSEFSGFNLTLDAPQSLFLKSFEIVNLNNVDNGSITFSQGSQSETFNFTGAGGTFNFSSFTAQSGTPIFVSSSGLATTGSAAFRLANFSVEEVPGPLPALGAFAAFGWAKSLRKKVSAKNSIISD
jgi:hypothetical protein